MASVQSDPFGGWVYWTRFRSNANRSKWWTTPVPAYGNSAMGGVINIVTTRPTRRTIEIKPQYGDRISPKFDFFASDRWNKVGVAVEGSYFNTDGFPIVAERERGPIDSNANVNYRNTSAKLDYTPTDRLRVFVRAGHFHEERDNAKASTIDGTEEANDTTWTTASGGVQIQLPDQSNLKASVFGELDIRPRGGAPRHLHAARTDEHAADGADEQVWRDGGAALTPRTCSPWARTGAGSMATVKTRSSTRRGQTPVTLRVAAAHRAATGRSCRTS